MQITNRLPHAGVMTGVRTRAAAPSTAAPLAALALAAFSLTACQDGFFFDPAQTRDTPIAVTYILVGNAPGAAPAAGSVDGSTGPRLSPGAAFDKADAAQVVLRSGQNELFNQRLPLEAVGSDKKISFTVELPAGAVVQASLSLTLLRGQDQLFTGTAQAQLTPGLSAEVAVPLGAVVARVAIQGGPFVIRTLGSTVRLTAAGLFATGDVAGTVTPTYQALTQNVTVAADGTVTAVTNGEGRVAATYLGRSDTAVVMVEDRCFGPFPNIAVGQTLNGTLEANDCLDAPNNTYNDWYFLTLGQPTLFRAAMTSSGFETFVGANLPAPPRRDLAVAANAGPSVVSEHFFPAGSYLLRTGARANPSLPAPPTGSYSLALTQASEPQEGCFQVGTSTGATWVRTGTSLSGRLAADDCAGPNNVRQDVYGIRRLAGDTTVIAVDGSFDYRAVYGPDVRRSPAGGGRVWWAFTSDADQSHYLYLRTDAPGPFGGYNVSVSGQIPPGYDACANPGVVLPVGAVGSPSTKSGQLQRRIDCESGDRVRDSFVTSTPSGAFRATLTSQGFDPFLAAVPPGGRTGFGRASTSGTVTAEFLFPAGQPYELRALTRDLISAGGRLQGSYTLSAVQASEPQAGCLAGTFVSTFVDFGSVASGRIASDDCRDLFAPDTATVTRWVDGYSILLQPGETVTVTLTADFPVNFTRWVGDAFADGRFGVPAGEARTFVVTQPAGGAAFHTFNAISGAHRATGSYSMTFGGTPAAGAMRAEGAAHAEALGPFEGGRPGR